MRIIPCISYCHFAVELVKYMHKLVAANLENYFGNIVLQEIVLEELVLEVLVLEELVLWAAEIKCLRQLEVTCEQRNFTSNVKAESGGFAYPGGIAVRAASDRYEDIQSSDS